MTTSVSRIADDCLHRVEQVPAHLQVVIAKFNDVFSTLEKQIVGLELLLTQSVLALLTRENLLVFSPAGTAKTLFSRLFFSRISGARIFDTQMSKGTMAEELFGPINIEEVKKGRTIHNTKGTLVDADFAFIDEFFDANDMVLRSLLGLFNERVFKMGGQEEQSNLHMGIAAANYVRATDVTEAVLDRFLFRSCIVPDFSTWALNSMDAAYDSHYGRISNVLPEEQVPLEDIARLADVVCGRSSEAVISAAPHILFLKNCVLKGYIKLHSDFLNSENKKPPYISPRTFCKSRLVLNASALLAGRLTVTIEDLSHLKYAVTTIGGSNQQTQLFERALREQLAVIRHNDLMAVDNLMAAQELAAQLIARIKRGQKIPYSGFLQWLLHRLRLRTDGDLTFAHVRHFVENINPQAQQVSDLKEGVLRRMQQLSRRIDSKEKCKWD